MISQLFIALCGLSAIWFSQQKSWRQRRWASILGLMAQPFWLIATYQAGQWGIFTLSFAYAAVWAKGFHAYWLAADRNQGAA
jgi:hypothetical protein